MPQPGVAIERNGSNCPRLSLAFQRCRKGMFELQHNNNDEDHFKIDRTSSCSAVSGWPAIAGRDVSDVGRSIANTATSAISEISKSVTDGRVV